MLQFYGKQVPYDGKELGIYKLRDKSAAASMLPEYAVCDVFHLEAQAREIPREKFIDAMIGLRELAQEQSGGSIGSVGFLLRPTNFSEKRQALENTRHFVDQVLNALEGK